MAYDPSGPIIIADGFWMHIPHTRICHRHYPEVRGEGKSLAEAASHMANQPIRALDSAHGRRGREAIERAIADVRSLQSARTGHQPRYPDTVVPSGFSPIPSLDFM
jgi:hypothetical protein